MERHSLIRKSFVHLAGVGPKTEAQLWRQGVGDWDELRAKAPRIFKGRRLDGILAALDASLEAWGRRDLYFFHQALPGNERWRMVPGGFEDVAYLDIEATGGSFPPVCHSTAVAFYFRGEVLQEHETAKKRALIDRILAEASMLCTFNGGGYDVPFLSQEYGMRFPIAHVDLCPWLRRLGFRGGLKAIQKALPHLHQRASMDIDGFDAVKLWALHLRGVEGALDTLMTYNAEDTLILEPLLVEAFNREVDARPDLGLERLIAGPTPRLATEVVPAVYALLRSADAEPAWRWRTPQPVGVTVP